jgi:hypothetical protein
VLAVAASLALAAPLAGPLAAQASEFGALAVRQVLGHQDVDGDMFDFREGEAVWSDTGSPVAGAQIRTMPAAGRQEFYASMGLAAPPEVLSDAPQPAVAAAPQSERIMVARDGREAPVLAEIRDRVAAARLHREQEFVAKAEPAVAADLLADSRGDRVAGAPEAETGPSAGARDAAQPDPGTLYGQLWAQVATERQAAKGAQPPEALVPTGTSAYALIWAEVQAERAASLTPPDLVDAPRTPDVAGVDEGTDLADAPPDRDLVDASAAFLEPRG